MNRIENQAIYSDQSMSLCYRHFGDCITPASSLEDALNIQNVLNAQHPSIQFEIELPDEDGFLSFLNTKIKVNNNGTVETKWYTKPANKGVILNANSHRPEQIKKAAIVNTITTYEAISWSDILLVEGEAERSFDDRVTRNGYKKESLETLKRKKTATHTIPFISESFTNDIRKAAQRLNLNVRIVQQQQVTLKIFW